MYTYQKLIPREQFIGGVDIAAQMKLVLITDACVFRCWIHHSPTSWLVLQLKAAILRVPLGIPQ